MGDKYELVKQAVQAGASSVTEVVDAAGLPEYEARRALRGLERTHEVRVDEEERVTKAHAWTKPPKVPSDRKASKGNKKKSRSSGTSGSTSTSTTTKEE